MLQFNQEKPKVNILIVDDKPANICSMQAILDCPDYHLVSATSGAEALKCILRQDFALILLDVMMPEMDGFEVARLVRQRGQKGVIPIIFLTAIATDFRYMQEGYAVGAVDYLQKPLDPDVVRAKVAVFVELHRRSEMIKEQEQRLRELQKIEQQRRLEDMQKEGERHFRKLADSLPQLILTSDRAGKIDFANPRWLQLSGSAQFESFHSESFLRILHPDDQIPFLSLWREALNDGHSVETELRLFEGPLGVHRWFLCYIQPEISLHGDRVGWLTTFTDIDSQKRREEAQRLLADASSILTASHVLEEGLLQLAERIAANFSDLVVFDLLNRGGTSFQRIVRARGGAAALEAAFGSATRLSDAQRLGAPALLSGGPELLAPLRAHAARFHESLIEQFQRGGALAQASLISAPIIVRGRIAGAMSLLRSGTSNIFTANELELLVDLCRHIALTMENLLLYEEVRDNNRLKDEFLALLSHELRTPLNSILGWTELSKMEATEVRVLEGLAVVERSAHTLAQLVNDLLDVSRIISGKFEISKEAVDITSFIKNVIAALQPLADSKRLSIHMEGPSDPPRIEADPSRLEQILWNLLNNAIKFTPAEGSVAIKVRAAAGKLEIEVSDTGIGIKAELIPFVFERFRQADSSSTRRHGGLGLGLAIVKHLAQLHEGSIRVASDGVGCGSTFTLTLPSLEAASLPAHAPGEEDHAAQAPRHDLEGLRVLLVDDDPSTRMLTAKQLSMSGAEVSAAASVAEAMECVAINPPDIVLTDIGMPEQDGFSLLRILRELEHSLARSIGIAAFSAYASQDDSKRALDEGFDIYLTKPISSAHLVQALVELRRGMGLFSAPDPLASDLAVAP